MRRIGTQELPWRCVWRCGACILGKSARGFPSSTTVFCAGSTKSPGSNRPKHSVLS
ncbi:hypothetical protein BC834DRAFT_897810 [Gloeopeniophorella convolvens]|nr:hypothetical protein BC834DRAFT_897810 [Gloeopeniophorella convolvens]